MAGAENELQGKEKREIARRHLVFYLRVFDGMSNRVLGHLADISSRGVMLISDAPLQVNQEFRLRMRLPKEIMGRSEIVLDAVSRWCKPDTNPDFYIAGFQIREMEAELEAQVRSLVEDFSAEATEVNNNAERPACSLTNTRGR